jgi:hypothetical protein
MTTAQYLSWFDEVLAPTEPMFRLVPGDKLTWKPTEHSFTVGQLIDHIPKSLAFNAKILRGDEWPLKSLREIRIINRRQGSSTVEEALVLFAAAKKTFKDAVGIVGDELFQHGEMDTPQRGKMPVWRFAAFALEHHIHHLMELHISLKSLGLNVDTLTLYKTST